MRACLHIQGPEHARDYIGRGGLGERVSALVQAEVRLIHHLESETQTVSHIQIHVDCAGSLRTCRRWMILVLCAAPASARGPNAASVTLAAAGASRRYRGVDPGA